MYQLSQEKLISYILGGKADFIVKEKDSAEHINFNVTKDPQNDKLYYVRYKSVNWDYIGCIRIYTTLVMGTDETWINFYPIKKEKVQNENQPIKAEIFRKLFLFIFVIGKLPSNLEIWYTGRCSICNRMLTDPTYIAIGIGKKCLENLE